MNHAPVMPQGGSRRDYTPLVSKVVIALVLLLGLVMIAAGFLGMNVFEASGFDAEDGYSAIRIIMPAE